MASVPVMRVMEEGIEEIQPEGTSVEPLVA